MAMTPFHPQHHPDYPERFVPRARTGVAPWREIGASELAEQASARTRVTISDERLSSDEPGRRRSEPA